MFFCTAVFTVNAAEENSGTVVSDEYRFEELSETTLSDNTIKSYTYGLTDDNTPDTTAYFTNCSDGSRYTLELSDCLNGSQALNTAAGDYEAIICYCGDGQKYNFEKTGGTYVLTKFKLSDYESYFNDNGTHTKTLKDYTHDYNFTKENDSDFSQLVILSGGYVNFVAPDDDGYVQAYICKNIGIKTVFFSFFSHRKAAGMLGSTDGDPGNSLTKLTIGKTDLTLRSIGINDATAIQKYSAEIEEFNNLQLRNADVNHDGKINIDDVTLLQKYIAGLL